MIGLIMFIEIILIIVTFVLFYLSEENYNIILFIVAIIFVGICIIFPIGFGELHGYINYQESNDRDLARITAVTQEQTMFKTYYKVEVEYLTNTLTQDGLVQNRNIEKDTFYCYFENKELVEKLKANQYKELWIISGYKGGYETYKDFGTKLIKDIELKE